MMRLVEITLAMSLGLNGANAAIADDLRAEAFADSVWEYVSDACPEAVAADPTVNAELRHLLGTTLYDSDSMVFLWTEAIAKDWMASQMSDADKRGFAWISIGAHGVLTQLEFQNVVVDELHLAKANYLEVEGGLRDHALASLIFLECLWPTTEDVVLANGQSGWGERGDEHLRAIAKNLYQSECKIAFLEMSRLSLEADFSNVPPEEREGFWGALLRSHEPKTAPEAVAERCEDFS